MAASAPVFISLFELILIFFIDTRFPFGLTLSTAIKSSIWAVACITDICGLDRLPRTRAELVERLRLGSMAPFEPRPPKTRGQPWALGILIDIVSERVKKGLRKVGIMGLTAYEGPAKHELLEMLMAVNTLFIRTDPVGVVAVLTLLLITMVHGVVVTRLAGAVVIRGAVDLVGASIRIINGYSASSVFQGD
jgi:hypothetical protein